MVYFSWQIVFRQLKYPKSANKRQIDRLTAQVSLTWIYLLTRINIWIRKTFVEDLDLLVWSLILLQVITVFKQAWIVIAGFKQAHHYHFDRRDQVP